MSKNINEELAQSVHNGEFDKVVSLLLSGADPNVVLEDKYTLLHFVKTPKIAETLLFHGANVNALNVVGETPLHSAINETKVSVVDVLLKHGADVNVKNNFGLSPLHWAINCNEPLSIVRKLLNHGANVNAVDKGNNTVLFLVVKYHRNLEIIKELLEFGADINVRSSSLHRFLTPLDLALRETDKTCAQLLIKVTVLNYYEINFQKILELRSYIKFNSYSILTSYVDICALEIYQMKMEVMNSMFSLFDYVKTRGSYVKPLYSSNTGFDLRLITKYKVYYEIIHPRLKLCVQRGHLFDKLKTSKIIFVSTTSKCASKQSAVNGDCLLKIGEFLSNDEILNFLIVIDDAINPSEYYLDNFL